MYYVGALTLGMLEPATRIHCLQASAGTRKLAEREKEFAQFDKDKDTSIRNRRTSRKGPPLRLPSSITECFASFNVNSMHLRGLLQRAVLASPLPSRTTKKVWGSIVFKREDFCKSGVCGLVRSQIKRNVCALIHHTQARDFEMPQRSDDQPPTVALMGRWLEGAGSCDLFLLSHLPVLRLLRFS